MPTVGQTIHHYRIVEKIGEGGMGEVYKAEDIRLDRFVALKFLPEGMLEDEDARTRFRSEALAASALDHPNICSIYDIGETDEGQQYLALAYCEGRDLSQRLRSDQPLTVSEAISIARQVAAGLAQAHAKGIVHRDIKPANIVVSSDGLVKILDFGIAKQKGGADITGDHTSLGSPAYMSPEQIRSEEPSPPGDLWSLGVVLYEMLTRSRPFPDENVATLMVSILQREHISARQLKPDLDPRLAAIVERSLSKDIARRYQTAEEMLRDLRALAISDDEPTQAIAPPTAARPPAVPSVGVMTFSDLSPEQDQGYFCEGLAEELTSALIQLPGLRVASRTSTKQFHEPGADIRTVGRQLGVDTLLAGSVRKAGDQIRVTTQLIKVDDGYLLSSERFDRKLEDIFAIQEEIARSLVETLKVQLAHTPGSGIIKKATDNMEAYSLNLKGRFEWNKRSSEGIEAGIAYFERAIEEDPGYALPHSGLADSYILMAVYGLAPEREVMPKARESSLRGLELDPDLAEAYVSLGSVRALFDWDAAGAEQDFRRAIELSPRYAIARHQYANNLLLMLGRFDEAVASERQALQLDPPSLALNAALGYIYCFQRDYPRAIAQFERTLDIVPNLALAHQGLAEVYLLENRIDDALAEIDAVGRAIDTSVELRATHGRVLAAAGRRDEAQAVLAELTESPTYVSPYFSATVRLQLGDTEGAMDDLEEALEERSSRIAWARHRPSFDPLREEPRFQQLLDRITL